MPGNRRQKKKFKISHVLEAIKGTAGIKVSICNKLRCSRVTFDKYLRECPAVAQAFREEIETFGDVVEAKLIALIRESGNDRASQMVHFQAIKFYCQARLKDRGYVERQEIEHTGERPVIVAPEFALLLQAREAGERTEDRLQITENR